MHANAISSVRTPTVHCICVNSTWFTKSIYLSSNTLRPGNQIDLHGLHVNEAVAALSEKLNQLDEGK